MKTRTIIAALVAAPAVLSAAITPVAPPPSAKTSARTVRMGDKDIADIQCRVRHSCIILFPADETVSFAAGGDVKGRWVMESGNPKRPSNLFSLKPAKFGPDAETNLNIVTTENRSYAFRLHSCEKCEPDTKIFVEHIDPTPVIVPIDHHLEVIAGLTAKVETAEAGERAAVQSAVTAKREAAEQSAREIAGFQKNYPLSMHTDYSYKRNKPPFIVRAIWCDSEHTYIQLAGELSSVYTMRDGKPEVVQFAYERATDGRGTFVLDRVLNSGYLALGRKSRLTFERIK